MRPLKKEAAIKRLEIERKREARVAQRMQSAKVYTSLAWSQGYIAAMDEAIKTVKALRE